MYNRACYGSINRNPGYNIPRAFGLPTELQTWAEVMTMSKLTTGKRMENLVCKSLVLYSRKFSNYYDEFLPQMRKAVQCQFNKSGHGFDILAVDPLDHLWVIEVSAGKPEGKGFGQYLVKTLEKRKRAGGNAQMSPEWRRYALEGFKKSPDAIEKLKTLFDQPKSEPKPLLDLLNLKFMNHSYAVIVPEGVHVEGDNPTMEFASSIYTFPLLAW
jgi:hypothetical protein